jgi:hypothetical protein
MECKECASRNVRNFNGELAIHFPGFKGLTKPLVWVFPKLDVCLKCGSTQFTVPEEQLRDLQRGLDWPDTDIGNALRN